MNKINGSLLVTLFFLLFLISSFIVQYDYFFFTRLAATAFASVYLVMEIKKDFFSANKILFILISILFMIGFGAGIWMDAASSNDDLGSRIIWIFVYYFILISISYNDLYSTKKEPA